MFRTSPAIVSFMCCALSGLVGTAHGNAFRGSGPTTHVASMQGDHLRAAMLEELMAALGSGNKLTAQRLERIEDVLRPIFLAMPKNGYGNLEHPGVRYALHRLFVLR